MGRTSRKSSEDYSSTKKRTTRSRDTSSPRRGSADKSNHKLDSIFTARKRDEKRDDKRDERKQTHDLRNHRVEKSKSKS